MRLLVEGCDEEKKNTLILTMIVAENNSTEYLDSMKEALESMTPEEKVCWVLGEEYTEEEEREGEKDEEGEGEWEQDEEMDQIGGADEDDGRGENVRKRMRYLNLGSWYDILFVQSTCPSHASSDKTKPRVYDSIDA
jgi:hypothetical protein